MSPSDNDWILKAEGLAKGFTLHLRGATIPVLRDVGLTVSPGECVALSGPSGAGKSTLMRLLQGNYGADAGSILVRRPDGAVVDLAAAPPRAVVALRRDTIGYVSQFLRVIPRVSALDVAAEPLLARGVAREEARARAAALLRRLNLPEHLHALPPATFSGGEQQRVNLARGFIAPFPLLLLDEPTASLDAANRAVVIGLIDEAKARGAALIGIFHDAEVRDRVADRLFEVLPLAKAA
ncbi:phosphonate C-P lyase system protein PhnL [Roseomonas sp. OT10]|uniref:phosphonate C-P lyase system protein PhnL n=1 Tax=Roseomonas cutis TaxID=2897332 RepID=UPI001E3DC356|nr:phosphonate C-P lyase system protein PhnL [Roseomonas sp. OT10]UFN48795.1 phosphonate C-P lyase system protein PhnL [Roseomonas sp. OT10]